MMTLVPNRREDVKMRLARKLGNTWMNWGETLAWYRRLSILYLLKTN